MSRHREREKQIIEKENMELELAKILIEEIRFNKDQLWKTGYYAILTYAGIFSVVSIFYDKIIKYSDPILYHLSYMIFIIIALSTIAISSKFMFKIYALIAACSTAAKDNKHKSIYFIINFIRHSQFTYFYSIFWVILIGYTLTIVNIFSLYVMISIYMLFMAIICFIIIEYYILSYDLINRPFRELSIKYDIIFDIIFVIIIFIVFGYSYYKPFVIKKIIQLLI